MPHRKTGKPLGRPRRKWTHYPAAFRRVVTHFLSSKEPLTYNVSRDQLATYRVQFYRFFDAIRLEYDGRPNDLDAAAIGLTDAFAVANNVMIYTDWSGHRLVFRLGDLSDPIQPVNLEHMLAVEQEYERVKTQLHQSDADRRAREQQAVDDKALAFLKDKEPLEPTMDYDKLFGRPSGGKDSK